MKKLKVILDCDGVSINFISGLCEKFNLSYEMMHGWEADWVWEIFPRIKDDHEFWENLPELAPFISVPTNVEVVRHLTACPHTKARKKNLKKLGWPKIPVTHSDNKVKWLIDHIDEWDVFVDDKPETIHACRSAFPNKHIIRFSPEYVNFVDDFILDSFWEDEKLQEGLVTLGTIKNLAQLKKLGYANSK